MTGSKRVSIEHLKFKREAIEQWTDKQGRHHDWPVVYLLNNTKQIYVGETTRARMRLREHLNTPDKKPLQEIRVVINDEFNKSACLDLESRLIAWLHADAKYAPLNRNDGQQNSNYFERHTRYQQIFDEAFNLLRDQGVFSRRVAEIENLNLFKLSPFKSLNDEQAVAVESILESLLDDLETEATSTSVIQGGPGTGKTVVAIFLLKLLADIGQIRAEDGVEEEGRFSDFFLPGNRELLQNLRIGLVVPQQSLRDTIKKVFRSTPGLKQIAVLSPFTVAADEQEWDILVVDETHRLTYRGTGTNQGMFNQRHRALFGEDASDKTAIDWIKARSRHQIFLVDGAQSVRPADVSEEVIRGLLAEAAADHRRFTLESQMRVTAGDDYLSFAEALLTDQPEIPRVKPGYDLRFYDDLAQMRSDIYAREAETGLARIVAGYAWKWKSKNADVSEAIYDIELDGVQMRWNSRAKDWIASPNSVDEVGSVHTVQGYDLNYAGVIIGPDIIWDEDEGRIRAVKDQHFDTEVRTRSQSEHLLTYIQNAYYVLLTRGIRGTYIYVCDPALRERIRRLMQARTH